MHTTRTDDEQGSALIFALVMLSVVGLMVGAALTYAGTSLRSSNNDIRPNRGSLYAADSAIQGAIQYVANNPQVGSDLLGARCTPDAFRYTDAKAGTVSVDVCPQANSFVYEGGVRAVLLTLAPSGNGIVQTKNSTLTVNGNVWSNSSVDVRGLSVGGGQVWSWNGCSGNVSATGGKDCATGATYGYSKLAAAINATQSTLNVAANAQFPTSGAYVVVVDNERMLVSGGQGTNAWTVVRGYLGTTAATHAANTRVSFLPKPGIDPGDPVLGQSADWQPAAAPSTPQSAPYSCALQPGVYSHGDDLSAASSSCPTLTLAPGVYYLNFPTDGAAASKSNNDDTWTVSNRLQGSSCTGDTDPGVQLVLAGPSRISNGDTIDLPCGSRATPAAPRIAVTSLNRAITAGTSTQTLLRPTAPATQAGDDLFAPATLGNVMPTAASGYPGDGTNATASFSGNKKSVVLNLGVAPPAGQSIPANAVIDAAVVKVTHDETTNAPFQSDTALQWGTCTVPLSPGVSTAAITYTKDVTASVNACGGFDPSKAASVRWSLKTSNGSAAKIDVDGAQLEITWHTPALPAQSGCVFHNAGGNCPAVGSASPNGHDSFLVNDVVYLPNSQLETTCKNSCTFNIGQALIAWQADLDANPAAVGDPIIGGNINTSGPGDVIFKAHVGTQPWISARVKYTATTRATSIASWVISH